jgi:hypothetical protein
MGCILILALVGLPRVALVALWLFRNGYVLQAFDGAWVWPVAGFFFLPTTTLAFAYGMNSLGAQGEMTPLAWLLTGIGLLFDLGTHGSGARSARGRRRKADA